MISFLADVAHREGRVGITLFDLLRVDEDLEKGTSI